MQLIFVEDSHPVIIDKDMREAVQSEMERRRVYANAGEQSASMKRLADMAQVLENEVPNFGV